MILETITANRNQPPRYTVQFEELEHSPNENAVAARALSITNTDTQLLGISKDEAADWSFLANLCFHATPIRLEHDGTERAKEPTVIGFSSQGLATLGSALIHFIVSEDLFLDAHWVKNIFSETESTNRRIQTDVAITMIAQLDSMMIIVPTLWQPTLNRQVIGF